MRYKVIETSQSCHCCFEATVVDTTKPVKSSDGRDLGYFDSICECFSVADAIRIAAAMNATG